MPEPDFLALLSRLKAVAETETALATIEILDRIGDLLPEEDPIAIDVRDVLHRAHGIALLRVSDARPSNDPVVSARSAAQYALAILFTLPPVGRNPAVALFVEAADKVFAEVRRSGVSLTGTIYFIRHGRQPEIKIGYATSWKNRRAALATAMPFGVVELALDTGTMADEADLHQRFADLRIADSEWFTPGEDLLKHIELLASRQASSSASLDERSRRIDNFD